MEVSWFFMLHFFLHCFSSSSFADDGANFFKEGVVGIRTKFFAAWILGVTLLVFVTIIVEIYKLKKKYEGKMLTTKMSYLQTCN